MDELEKSEVISYQSVCYDSSASSCCNNAINSPASSFGMGVETGPDALSDSIMDSVAWIRTGHSVECNGRIAARPTVEWAIWAL